jgi:uncharacterized membrane protein YqiK
MLLNMLPDLVANITETVADIEIDRITVIDGAGGSDGGGVGAVAGQLPAAVISLVEQIETATGVNLLEVLTRNGDLPGTAPADAGTGSDNGDWEAPAALTEGGTTDGA